jgi:hypothetical protein
MESVLLNGEEHFDYAQEEAEFNRLFTFLARTFGREAFVKFRGTSAVGGLAPAYFEAVSVGTWRVLDYIEGKDRDTLKEALMRAVQSSSFREVTGPGANKQEKLRKRIDIIAEALSFT